MLDSSGTAPEYSSTTLSKKEKLRAAPNTVPILHHFVYLVTSYY